MAAKSENNIGNSPTKRARSRSAGNRSVHNNPDHSSHKPRLNRIKGQIEGIERMIDEKRYCLDIINQIRAAQSALKGLQNQILEHHLKGCVKAAFETKDLFDVEKKIQEIVELV